MVIGETETVEAGTGMEYTPPREHSADFPNCWCQAEGYTETDFHPVQRELSQSRISRHSGTISRKSVPLMPVDEEECAFRPQIYHRGETHHRMTAKQIERETSPVVQHSLSPQRGTMFTEGFAH